MPYTDDPANVPADRVRFLLGDTGEPYDLTDNEVAFLLSDQGEDAVRAAARGAEVLTGRYTKTVTEKRVGPLSLKTAADKSRSYSTLAKQLWMQSASRTGAPYAGGISRADKVTKASNPDKVQPTFRRRMMEYPQGDENLVGTAAEVLSPDAP